MNDVSNFLRRAALWPLASLVSLGMTSPAQAQPEIALYEGAIPNAIPAPDEEATRDPAEAYVFRLNVSRPTLTVYLSPAPDPKRAAVIILPGGSYRGVSIEKEGHAVAHAFNAMGVAAFVLRYRTPSARHMQDPATGPLQDVQQAFALVHRRAREWNIEPTRIGVLGFSAGGHLASTAATRFDRPVLRDLPKEALRPDFLVLIYPVISMRDGLTHAVSRQQLLGDAPSQSAIEEYSNESQVGANTPPTFIVHAADDAGVPVANSLRFFEALQAHKIPAELIVYPSGGHGFGLNNATTPDRWIDRCRDWLKSQGFLQ